MFDSFLENITKWNVILGLIIAVIAFVLMLTAKPITNAIFKNKAENDKTNIVLMLKIAAAVLVLVGCVFVMFIK